jgi:hypothetical protein
MKNGLARRSGICALAALLMGFAPPQVTALAAEAAPGPAKAKKAKKAKVLIGRLEHVHIKEANTTLTGKVDTGTQTSSLHARDITIFPRGGKDYVRFTFDDDNGKAVTLERPLVRLATFKDNARAAPARAIVTLGLCIGNLYRRTQVNLADRGHFDYSLLIGRRFLFGHAVVDTAKKFTAKPACGKD